METVGAMGNITFPVATRMIDLLMGSPLPGQARVDLSRAVNSKIAVGPQLQSTKERANLQTCLYFHRYLTKGDWETLIGKNGDHEQMHVPATAASRLGLVPPFPNRPWCTSPRSS